MLPFIKKGTVIVLVEKYCQETEVANVFEAMEDLDLSALSREFKKYLRGEGLLEDDVDTPLPYFGQTLSLWLLSAGLVKRSFPVTEVVVDEDGDIYKV